MPKIKELFHRKSMQKIKSYNPEENKENNN
jgi:hypothetical protein